MVTRVVACPSDTIALTTSVSLQLVFQNLGVFLTFDSTFAMVGAKRRRVADFLRDK